LLDFKVSGSIVKEEKVVKEENVLGDILIPAKKHQVMQLLLTE